MAGRHHRCDEHELGKTPGDGDGQGGLACGNPLGCKKLDMTGQLNNNNKITFRSQEVKSLPVDPFTLIWEVEY